MAIDFCQDGTAPGCPIKERHSWDVRCPADAAWLQTEAAFELGIVVSRNETLADFPPETREVLQKLRAMRALKEAANGNRRD